MCCFSRSGVCLGFEILRNSVKWCKPVRYDFLEFLLLRPILARNVLTLVPLSSFAFASRTCTTAI